MKKKIFKLSLAGVIVFASLTSYGQQNKSAEKARKDVVEAQNDLRKAKNDSIEDYKKFRADADKDINENQRKIDELRAKKSSDSKEMNEKYQQKVSDLEKKNDELRKKVSTSENTTTGNWSSFKREFSHDMEEFGRAFKDLGVNNEK